MLASAKNPGPNLLSENISLLAVVVFLTGLPTNTPLFTTKGTLEICVLWYEEGEEEGEEEEAPGRY